VRSRRTRTRRTAVGNPFDIDEDGEPAQFGLPPQRFDLFTDSAQKSRENDSKRVKRDGAWHETSISVVLTD
jgi:hypothetical protein